MSAKTTTTKSKAELEQENNELKNQLEELKQMIMSVKESTAQTATLNTTVESVASVDVSNKIEANDFINVTSITTGGVNIRAGAESTAKAFRFDKIGQTLPIMNIDLANAINTQRDFFEEGLLYINNPTVVKNNYLEEFYSRFLTYDKITNILEFDVETIRAMVANTTRPIQETIAHLVAEKINKGDWVDMNKVEAISKACTPEIDIRHLAEALK